MIRPAALADAAGIARVQVRTWHRMFADIVPPEETPDLETQTAAWTEALVAGIDALVVDGPGGVVAVAATGAARDEDALPGTGEVLVLSVDPVAQGAGLGGALLRAACGALAFAGHASAVAWTPVENPAREWLEREGWFPDAGPVEEHGVLAVPEIRLRRPLP